MSDRERQVQARLAQSGRGERPAPDWQESVFRTIRDEAQPARLRLVALVPDDVRGNRAPRRTFVWGGLTFAAAVLAFFLVLSQRPDDRITRRTEAIAMVVEFVELETELALALAEIDVAEARMDEAFDELQVTLATHERPVHQVAPVIDTPIQVESSDRFREVSIPRNHSSEARRPKASAVAGCGDAGDLMCGL